MQHLPSVGARIGLHVPDAFGPAQVRGREIPIRCAALGVSVVELDATSLESYLGAPVEPALLHPPELTFEHGLLPLEEEVFQEELDLARASFAARVRTWRSAVSLEPLEAFRREYDEAGVLIEIVRWPALATLADDELDYGFRIAQAAGARAISTELSSVGVRRLGPIAERHGLVVGFYADESAGRAEFEDALGRSPSNGASLDLGSWIVGGHGSPLPFLAEHADRVTHVHLKDRRTSDGATTWFGQGDAPIRAVLQAMRRHGWGFQATVEIAYDLATKSLQLAEIGRAIEYCRSCLVEEVDTPT